MKKIFKPKIRKQSGVVAVEYAIMVGFIALGLVFGIAYFGMEIVEAYLIVKDTIANEVTIFKGIFDVFACTYPVLLGSAVPAGCS